MIFGYDIWRRLGRVRQHHTVTSIADFIAARYGKMGSLATLVTLLAVLAILPYLALQLRAIAMSTNIILEQHSSPFAVTNSVLLLTGLLAILAMLFGTRRIANTEQHGGLMLAVAFESFVKLFSLIAVAVFFLFASKDNLHQVSRDVAETVNLVQQVGVPDTFWIQTLLAALAMICLPRQFHVAVVELKDENHINGARRWFGAYLILTILAIIPLASWAIHAPSNVLPVADAAVLMLPMSYGNDWLTLLAFLGGFSASTGMLLVSSVALSIMLSNDLIMPVLWRFNIISRHDPRMPQMLKLVRRISILAVMLLGFSFYHCIGAVVVSKVYVSVYSLALVFGSIPYSCQPCYAVYRLNTLHGVNIFLIMVLIIKHGYDLRHYLVLAHLHRLRMAYCGHWVQICFATTAFHDFIARVWQSKSKRKVFSFMMPNPYQLYPQHQPIAQR